MRPRQINEEVFFAEEKIVKVGPADIKFLKERAGRNRRKRARLCAHRNIDDALHEMLIVHKKGAYIRPHKHLNKIESFHVIEGIGKVIVFDELGNITEIIQVQNSSSQAVFYYRISDASYHTLLISSDFLVFHETTNGPFKKDDTIFAPWAPDEDNSIAVKKYIEKLTDDAENFINPEETEGLQ